MQNNILTDIKTCVSLFVDIRKARKVSEETEPIQTVQAQTVRVPVFRLEPGLYSTPEGCTLSWLDKEIVEAARMEFNSLSYKDKYRFAEPPKDGEFIERAYFWKALLEPVLTPKQLRTAMVKILGWYIHIKQMRM